MKQFTSKTELDKWIEDREQAEMNSYPNTEEGQKQLIDDMLMGRLMDTVDHVEALKAEGYDLYNLTANGDRYCFKVGNVRYENR